MNKIFYYILPWCILWVGCSDFLEYKDKDKIIPKELKHYHELIYGELIKNTSGDEMEYLQFMTDEIESVVLPLSSKPRSDKRREQFSNFTWAPNNQLDQNEEERNDKAWALFYHKILMCNIIENDLKAFENDFDGVKKRMLGEVAFIRAMSYYYLVNMYGEPYKDKEQAKTALGVPINTAISVETKVYTRAKLQDVYHLIENDLLLAVSYLTEGEQLNIIFRPNVDIARLFLSRIYLCQKEWEKVLSTTNELIAKSKATVETRERMANYISARIVLYNSNNPGILYSWGKRSSSPLSSGNSEAGHWEVSSELRAMYLDNDIRGKAFFNEYKPFYPYKYNPTSRTCYDWSYRIEEGYLNRAEACFELGGAANIKQALSDINAIRKNRLTGNYEVKTEDAKEAMKMLQDEKKMEFCFEDTRWFDIRRWETEITHKVHYLNTPLAYDTYVLKAGSPNYILSIPLEVQKINDKIEQFERVETLVSKKQ